MCRRILTSASLVLILAGCATEQKCPRKHSRQTSVGSVQKVRTTAYTHTEAGGRHAATGTSLCGTNTKGKVKSAAADWSRFPLGTKFQILSTGEIYEVCDYGSALVGKDTIDLYKESRREMRKWGARYVDIKILRWGSAQKSLQVLSPRRSPHVRSMVNGLREET